MSITDLELEDRIRRALRTNTTLFIRGEPGIYKSAYVRYYAQRHDYGYCLVLVAHKDPVDLVGWPVVQRKEIKIGDQSFLCVHYAPPGFALEALASQRFILHLDEITCGTTFQVNMVAQVVLDHTVGELKLDPKRVGVIVSGNPVDIAMGGAGLTPPVANRIKHYDHQMTEARRDYWLKGFPSYWDNPPILEFAGDQIDPAAWARARSLVTAFLKCQPVEKLHQLPKDLAAREGPWPSMRTWDLASRDLADTFDRKERAEEAVPHMVEWLGTVADEFSVYLTELDIPDPEEVLEREIESFDGANKPERWQHQAPSPFQLPDRGDRADALLGSLAAMVSCRLDRARGKALMRILKASADQGGKDLAAAHGLDGFFKNYAKSRPPAADYNQEMAPFAETVRAMHMTMEVGARSAG